MHALYWNVAITNDGFKLIEGNYNGYRGIIQTSMQKIYYV